MPLFEFDFSGVTSAKKEVEEAKRDYYRHLAEAQLEKVRESQRLSSGAYTPQEISDMNLKSSEADKNYAMASDYRSQSRSRAPYDDPMLRDKLSAEVGLLAAQQRVEGAKAAQSEFELERSKAYGENIRNYVTARAQMGEQIGSAQAEFAQIKMTRQQNPMDFSLIAAEKSAELKLQGLENSLRVFDDTFLIESMPQGNEAALQILAQRAGLDPKSVKSSGDKSKSGANTFKYKSVRKDPLDPNATEEIEADIPQDQLGSYSQMLPHGAALKAANMPNYAPTNSVGAPMFLTAPTGNEPMSQQQLFGGTNNAGMPSAPAQKRYVFDPRTGQMILK